jgi:hypothetical protein
MLFNLNGRQRIFIIVALVAAQPKSVHAGVWWYDQAERLQNVSATLLDSPPISEPVPVNSGFLSTRFLTSLLPKPNPQVGSKQEKVPAAPLHVVPTLVAGFPVMSSGRYTLVTTAWGGYLPLPASVGKMIGVNASLTQFTFGASAENVFRLSNMFLITSIGFQRGRAKLEGAITAADAKDSFDATTSLFHVSQSVIGRRTPLWANGMVILRRGASKFSITREQTEFIRNDNMSDAQIPIASQVTLGLKLGSSFNAAISEYIVPDRLIMPRVSLIYQYRFSDKPEPAAEAPKPGNRQRKKSGSKRSQQRSNPERKTTVE